MPSQAAALAAAGLKTVPRQAWCKDAERCWVKRRCDEAFGHKAKNSNAFASARQPQSCVPNAIPKYRRSRTQTTPHAQTTQAARSRRTSNFPPWPSWCSKRTPRPSFFPASPLACKLDFSPKHAPIKQLKRQCRPFPPAAGATAQALPTPPSTPTIVPYKMRPRPGCMQSTRRRKQNERRKNVGSSMG